MLALGAFEAEFAEAEPEGIGMQVEDFGCSARSFNDPAGLAEDVFDVGTFDVLEGVAPGLTVWSGWRRGRGGRGWGWAGMEGVAEFFAKGECGAIGEDNRSFDDVL